MAIEAIRVVFYSALGTHRAGIDGFFMHGLLIIVRGKNTMTILKNRF
jgi:hypothetical protein